MRTLTILTMVCGFATGQDSAKLEQARRALVGVSAQRMIEMRGRQFPVRTQQVGVVIGEGLVLTASLGRDPQNLRVFAAGESESADAEVADSDDNYTILKVEDLAVRPVEFSMDWKPTRGQKLVWVALLGPAGKWNAITRETAVDAVFEDGGRAVVYADPPFSGPVVAIGALVLNGAGQAVGIVALKRNRNRPGGGGRRFALRQAGMPVVRPASAFAQYLGGAVRKRGMLGVSVETLTQKVAEAMELKGLHGVIVTQVTPGSGAARAGLDAQDVITKVDGLPVTDPSSLQKALVGKAAGVEVTLVVVRLAEEGAVTTERRVTLTARAESDKSRRFKAKRFGFTAEPLTPVLRRRHQLEAELGGVHVRRVVAGGPAAMGRPTALRRGDLILRVGQIPVPDVASLKQALKTVANGKPATLFVRNGRDTRFVEVTPEAPGE